MATKLGSLYYDLTLNDKDLNAKLSSVNGKMMGFGDRMGNVGKRMQDTGKKMTMGLTLPIVGGMAAATKSAVDFETRMSDISTLISGDSTQAVGQLKDGILELTKTVPKSADDLGASAYAIVSAGISDTSEALTVLESSGKLATAGLSTTEEATDILTSSINAFGLEASESDKVADILFKTVKNGKTTVSEMAQAFGATAPIVASAGVSLEEFSAATAAMTTTGLPASQAQNQLRQAIVSLQKPTADMANLFEEAGIESGDAALKQHGLVGTMELLNEAADGNSEKLAKAFGSVEAFGAATSLTGETNEAFTDTLESMTGGADAMSEAFDKQADTTGAKIQKVKNQFTALGISIGDQLAPHLEALGEKISGIIEWFGNLTPEQQKMVLMIAGIVAAIGPMLIIIGKLVMAIKSIAAAFTFLQAHPAVLIVTAIILLIAGLAYLIIRNWDTLKKWFGMFWNWLKDVASGVWDWLKGAAQFVIDAIMAYVAALKAFWTGVWNGIKAIVKFVFDVIWGIIKFYINAWINIFKTVRNVIVGAFNFIKNTITNVFRTAWNVVKSIWGGVGNFFGRVKDGISGAFSKVTGKITGPFKTAFNAIARFWNNSVGKLSFKAPDWVPGMGGKGFEMPQLPLLAKGGVATGPTMAMIGEAGTEAVLPLSELDRYSSLFDKIENTAKGMDGGNMGSDSGVKIELHMDGVMARSRSELRDIAKDLIGAVNEELRAKGKQEIQL